jgi:hypothetical protein
MLNYQSAFKINKSLGNQEGQATIYGNLNKSLKERITPIS